MARAGQARTYVFAALLRRLIRAAAASDNPGFDHALGEIISMLIVGALRVWNLSRLRRART